MTTEKRSKFLYCSLPTCGERIEPSASRVRAIWQSSVYPSNSGGSSHGVGQFHERCWAQIEAAMRALGRQRAQV